MAEMTVLVGKQKRAEMTVVVGKQKIRDIYIYIYIDISLYIHIYIYKRRPQKSELQNEHRYGMYTVLNGASIQLQF